MDSKTSKSMIIFKLLFIHFSDDSEIANVDFVNQCDTKIHPFFVLFKLSREHPAT